ncbi:ATP-binding cassette domain-containing protein [Thalassospiraceae bacterium SW-3-3]|nr:ATP-binding cassette domain-containing protein [Thalassospiraceae bacterium SW-3-3]
MSNSFVELNNVRLRYSEGDDLALETTNMKINKGEFIAVVGPSGCGKSSLLKLVSGLMPPSEGTVIVDNKEVSGPLKIVGMAFQNPTLLPWRTTLDNVLLPMEIVKPHRNRLRKHRAEYEDRARKLLASVGLAGHEDKYPWELSGRHAATRVALPVADS